MASGLESQAVFSARGLQIGFSQVTMDLFKAANVDTMGKLAYACAFQPGSPDETPLLDLATKILTGIPTTDQMAIFRRLYYESHTVALVDMRSRVDSTGDEVPKKLQAPERAARYRAQQARMPGLTLTGEYEPSYGLIDAAVAQYDGNELKYLAIENCTSREQELMGDKKDVDLIKIDRSKTLKLATEPCPLLADVSSDLKVKNALFRRALAYDQAGLITFVVQESWITKMFRLMAEPAIDGYSPITLQQCLRADRKLFVRMAEATRESIIPTLGHVRPLDAAMTTYSEHQEVTHLLSPLMNTGRSREGPYSKGPREQKGKSTKGEGKSHRGDKGKGKGSGKKGGQGKSQRQLRPEHCTAVTPDGKYICFAFNSAAGCQQSSTRVGDRCNRGYHLCGKAGCHGNHSQTSCTS